MRRPRFSRSLARRIAGVVVVAIVFAGNLGCERGCLTRAVTEKKKVLEAPVDLTGSDCPADLYRCRAGRIERSLVGHVPMRCERVEGCACPFVAEGMCGGECLLEDTALALEDGGASLCATPGARAVPVLSPPPENACDSDDARCLNGAVVRCAPTPRTVARCLRGCAGPGTLEAEATDRDLDVLCRP